ncbi:MAG: ABC transporter substrate-binding protein [Lachnospiraceae bacterium]|nr:ABC transporter substrate-binding protein [Lachnospiraceae bacterium]
MRFKKIVALAVAGALTVASLAGCGKKEEAEVRVGVLKGPTGIGAVEIMDKSESGEYEKYSFTLTPDVQDIVAKLTNGDLDIGALPTNVAATLYNKTSGDVRIIALNCLGVLYILENGDSIKSVADLKGKTIVTTGQGSNPEYVLNFILRKNGLEPGQDVTVEFKESSDVVTTMVSGKADVCMLPVPAATTVLAKNKNVREALDVTAEYDKVADDDSRLTMGSLVARKSFIDEHPDDIKLFLERYSKSIEHVLSDLDASAELVAKYEIVGAAAIAKQAIPKCGIVCITGKDIKPAIEGYYKVLFEASPKAIGGAMPGDDFYYEK